jgi:hypothetical protein
MRFCSARLLRFLAGLCCVAAFGCQPHDAASKRQHGPVGVLSGHIRLAAGAQLPQYTSLDLVRRPLRLSQHAAVPSACQSANESARTAVQLTATGFLAGVAIAASDFTRVRERAPQTHHAVIENCRLSPSLIAATGGDTLSIENRDDFGFEPLVGPAYEGRPLRRGQKKLTLPLFPGEVDSILCSLGAPCGRTDLVVFFHPVHAVTDASGSFRIDNFPAAELVRVNAWHPLFEETEIFIWLEPGQKTSVELTMTPKQRFVPVLDVPHAAAASLGAH